MSTGGVLYTSDAQPICCVSLALLAGSWSPRKPGRWLFPLCDKRWLRVDFLGENNNEAGLIRFKDPPWWLTLRTCMVSQVSKWQARIKRKSTQGSKYEFSPRKAQIPLSPSEQARAWLHVLGAYVRSTARIIRSELSGIVIPSLQTAGETVKFTRECFREEGRGSLLKRKKQSERERKTKKPRDRKKKNQEIFGQLKFQEHNSRITRENFCRHCCSLHQFRREQQKKERKEKEIK